LTVSFIFFPIGQKLVILYYKNHDNIIKYRDGEIQRASLTLHLSVQYKKITL